jgi:hypothetical protein
VFSPIAWNLAIDDFLYSFDKDPSISIGFADDGTLLTSGLDPETLTHLAQSALRKATHWSSLIGLTFSHHQTTVVFFHRKNSSPKNYLNSYSLTLPWNINNLLNT